MASKIICICNLILSWHDVSFFSCSFGSSLPSWRIFGSWGCVRLRRESQQQIQLLLTAWCEMSHWVTAEPPQCFAVWRHSWICLTFGHIVYKRVCVCVFPRRQLFWSAGCNAKLYLLSWTQIRSFLQRLSFLTQEQLSHPAQRDQYMCSPLIKSRFSQSRVM